MRCRDGRVVAGDEPADPDDDEVWDEDEEDDDLPVTDDGFKSPFDEAFDDPDDDDAAGKGARVIGWKVFCKAGENREECE